MNILYVAYSCAPNKGSEERIGWNVPMESAKNNNVFVVTKEEHRNVIEEYLREHNIVNPKFYYVDINRVYKKLFKGAMYPMRLNIWQKKAFPVVNDICRKENIDVIHQVTPVEFRSIGKYAAIDNIPFVCGPVGGGETLPEGLKVYAKRNMFVENLRSFLNRWSCFKYRISGALKKSNYILFANKETQERLRPLIGNVNNRVFTEIGMNEEDIADAISVERKNTKPVFLVAGRLVYRKGHSLLLDALKLLPSDFDYQCRIVGDGPERASLEAKCWELNLQDKVVFTGKLPFTDMAQEYDGADVFIMPSIRETTGSVLLEAIAKGLPVITINRFGGKVLLDDSCSYFYDGVTSDDFRIGLKDAILKAAADIESRSDIRSRIIDRAKEQLWQNKLKVYNSIYNSIVVDKE